MWVKQNDHRINTIVCWAGCVTNDTIKIYMTREVKTDGKTSAVFQVVRTTKRTHRGWKKMVGKGNLRSAIRMQHTHMHTQYARTCSFYVVFFFVLQLIGLPFFLYKFGHWRCIFKIIAYSKLKNNGNYSQGHLKAAAFILIFDVP